MAHTWWQRKAIDGNKPRDLPVDAGCIFSNSKMNRAQIKFLKLPDKLRNFECNLISHLRDDDPRSGTKLRLGNFLHEDSLDLSTQFSLEHPQNIARLKSYLRIDRGSSATLEVTKAIADFEANLKQIEVSELIQSRSSCLFQNFPHQMMFFLLVKPVATQKLFLI